MDLFAKTKELLDDPALFGRRIKCLAELCYAADAESLTEEQIALHAKEVATRRSFQQASLHGREQLCVTDDG